MIPVSIYALINPFTKQPFYIGATVKPLKYRLSQHVSESKSTPSKSSKHTFILKCIKRNRKIKIELLRQVDICEASKYETYYYNLYKESGCDLMQHFFATNYTEVMIGRYQPVKDMYDRHPKFYKTITPAVKRQFEILDHIKNTLIHPPASLTGAGEKKYTIKNKKYKMKTLKLENDFIGMHIQRVIENAKRTFVETPNIDAVEFEFNGVKCLVNNLTNPDLLIRDYENASLMKWESVGPVCDIVYDHKTEENLLHRKAERQKRWDEQEKAQVEKDKKERESFEASINGITLQIITGKEDEYASYVKKNSEDGYSRCVVDYAEGWGKLMQKEVEKGDKIQDCAEPTSHQLSFLGITGYMYGAAVSALAHFWIHGEELRKWHNKEYNHDGAGVVNPAVLTISTN